VPLIVWQAVRVAPRSFTEKWQVGAARRSRLQTA